MDFRQGRFGINCSTSSGPFSVCRTCNMTIREIINFLSQDRTHMQQGLFPDVQQMYLLQSLLTFDEVSMRALLGANLKPAEFLKLEQTCLADVIVEESGNEHLRIEDIPVSVDAKRIPSAVPVAAPPVTTPPIGIEVKWILTVLYIHVECIELGMLG